MEAMARAAVDMSRMNDLSTAAQQAACNEILSRVNRDDPAMSLLFRNPDPASGVMHAFKFRTSAELSGFQSSLLLWLATE
jgi:hypothetical protein